MNNSVSWICFYLLMFLWIGWVASETTFRHVQSINCTHGLTEVYEDEQLTKNFCTPIF